VELAFGIRDFAKLEAGWSVGPKIGGDEVVFGFFAGVDVEAGTDFQDYGNLECAAAADGIEGYVSCGGDDVLGGRNLLRC